MTSERTDHDASTPGPPARAAVGGPAAPDGGEVRAPGPMAPAYRLVTVVVIAQVTLVAFESMAVTTAMPVVAHALDAMRSYGLAFSLFLSAQLLGTVLAGSWCDLRGPLPSTVVGQVGLAAGSTLAGLATSFPMLLVGRVVAGLGGGMLVVALYVMIGRAYPEHLRPRVFGWVSAAWVLPAVVGPVLAAWLASLSWRLVFLVCVPPIVVTAVLTLARRSTVAPPGHVGSGREAASHRRAALAGTLVAVGAGGLQWGSEYLDPLRPAPVLVAVAGLAVVALVAPRLVPAGTARMRRGLPSVIAARFLLTAAFNGSVTFIPLMLVAERHTSTTLAGVMLTLGSLGWSLGAALQGRESVGRDRYRLLGLGGVVLAASLLLLAAVPALGLSRWVVPVAAALQGLGMGLAMSTVSVLGLDLSPVEEHGQASASLQLADTLGSALGVAATGALFAGMHRSAGHDAPAYVVIWLVCACSGALVVLAGRRARPRSGL